MTSDTETRILSELADLSRRQRTLLQELDADRSRRLATVDGAASFADLAAWLVRGRHSLSHHIGGDFFGDPAFDMLLELFAAAENGETRSIKACAFAARAAHTTTLRYIDVMEEAGLLVRSSDPHDGRRTLIALTPSAREHVRDWLGSISFIHLRSGGRDRS